MSWLNSSFNQFTSITGQIGGQISNFTKEVLTETSEENIDYEVEAKKLAEELKHSQALSNDLSGQNSALKQRIHKAELLVSTSENEWKNKLEEKNRELDQLRFKLGHQISDSSHPVGGRSRDPVFSPHFSTISLTAEEDDFHDIISKQREIDSLSEKLENARKKIIELEDKAKNSSPSLGMNRGKADSVLEHRILELEDELRRESDHHHKEMRALEDLRSADIRRYQDEITRLKQVKSDVTDLTKEDSGSDLVISMKKETQKLQLELDDLKNQMRTRNRQLQAQKKQIDEMTVTLESGDKKIQALMRKIDEDERKWNEEKKVLTSRIQRETEKMEVIKKGITQLTTADGSLSSEDDLESLFADFVSQFDSRNEERVNILAENAQYQTQIIGLQNEILMLQHQNKLDGTGRRIDGETESSFEERNTIQSEEENDVQRYRQGVLPSHLELGPPLCHSSPQVNYTRRKSSADGDNGSYEDPGDLTLTRQALQKQIEDYESEIAQYEHVKKEWQSEKQSLQELLNRYQSEAKGASPQDERALQIEQLKSELTDLQIVRGDLEKETNRLLLEKEQLQVATKSLEQQMNESIMESQLERDSLLRNLEKHAMEKEKLQAAYDILTQELNESRQEKDALDEALDALDSQHQDEMAQLLSVRDDLKSQLNEVKRQLETQKASPNDNGEKFEVMEQSFSKETEKYMKEIEDRNQKIEDLEKEKSTLLTKVADFNKVKNDETELCDNLKAELVDREAKIFELEEKLRGMQIHHERLQNSENSISQQNSETQLTLDAKNKEICELKDRIHKANEDLIAMQSNFDIERTRLLEEKNEVVKKLETEKDSIRNELNVEILRLQTDVEELGKEVEESGKEIMKMKVEHSEALKKSENDRIKAIEQIQGSFEKERQFSEKEDAAATKVYQEKILHIEKMNTDLTEKLEKLQLDYSKAVNDSEIMSQTLQKKHDDLLEQYNVLSETQQTMITSHNQEIFDLNNRLKTVTDEKTQLHDEYNNLMNTLDNLKISENDLRDEMSALQQQIAKYKQEMSSLQEKNDAMEKESNQKVDNLLADIERLKKDLADSSALRQQMEKYKQEVFSLQGKNESMEKEANQRIDNLLAELERLKKDLDDSNSTQHINAPEELLARIEKSDIEKSDLSKDDIGALLKLIKERDLVIESLKRLSGSQNSPSSPEMMNLKEENRTLVADKEQILAVISEKTRENKKLKDELHKMVGIVAESNAALEKVQHENNTLVKKYEGYDDEMTKEAVSKLSRLVREKEQEIDLLKQKCHTLVEVLQQQPVDGNGSPESMISGEQVQNLLRDKEILTSQVQQLLNERNHLVTLLNLSQAEVENARTEAAKAAEALERDADNNSKLQIGYSNLVHDYDQVQLKLSSVQRELTNLQGKMRELQSAKLILLDKVGADPSSVQISQESLQKSSSLSTNHQNEENARSQSQNNNEKIEILQKDSKEKDLLIHAKSEELKHVSITLKEKSNEVEILRRSVENLREQVAELTKSCSESRLEFNELTSKLKEKESESQAFQETNAQLSVLLKEKEYELENLREKCQRLEGVLKECQEGTKSESQKFLDELDNSKQALIHARHERDQIMLSLKQKKMEADKFAEEARTSREKEVKLQSELERLRNHLIQVEEAYTQEAVLAEDKVNNLREQLEQARSSQNAVREAGEQSQQQAESLQEQLRGAIGQRDHAIQQLQLSQEQSIQYATALQKLQVAVERMQREEAATYAEQLEKIKSQLEQKIKDADSYEALSLDLKAKLDNANDALQSASRLNAQLEAKEENINQLKDIVSEKQLQNDELLDRIHALTSKNEGMVDKEILKNLFMGYFTSPNNKRQDVLRLISGVLNFSQDEMHKITSGSQGGARAWIGGWLWKGDNSAQKSVSVPVTPRRDNMNESFTEMFVKFLETESVPHKAPRLPTAAMINEAQQKRRTPSYSGSSSVPTPVSPTQLFRNEPVVAGRYSPYLLSSNSSKGQSSIVGGAINPVAITPVLPTFEPIINPKPAGEQEILQDILLNRTDS